MLLVVRPFAARLVRRYELRKDLPQGAIAAVFVGLLLSALATEAIGIHAIFGAFLLGAIVPHDSLLARELIRRLEDVVVVLFLPAFFAFTGLRTQVALLSDASYWGICLAIIAVASLGKFGGSFVAARLTGLPTRDALRLGILMNTRGLMELVVLNLGLDLGLISPTLFAMLVLMAVATTLATTPILQLIGVSEQPEALLERSSG
jgi:Kef-type K+ transport system membrane component KefB